MKIASRLRLARRILPVLILACLLCVLKQANAAPTSVGVNLPWIAYGHSFDADGLKGFAGSYSSTTVQAAADDLKAKHLNICRVFIFDDLEGVISNGNVNTIITPSTTYIANLTDFVNRMNADGVTVYLTMFNAWDFVTFPSTLKVPATTLFNNSAMYSSTGPIQTVGRAMAGKNVIWDFLNEGNNMAQYYNNGWVDLVGWVNMNTWMSNTRTALHTAGATQKFTISCNDPNVIMFNRGTSNTSDLLNANNVDFWDCHEYNDTGTISITSSTIGDGKPVYCGEFGPSSQNWSSTSDNVTQLVQTFYNNSSTSGLTGLEIWAYLTDGSGNQTQGTAELTELSTLAGGTGGTAPPTPTGLTATAGNAQVVLSWSASTGATSYNVYRGSSSGGEGTTAFASGITSTSYTNTGLTNGTTYFYKVAAVNTSGTSAQSSEVSAKPAAGTTPSFTLAASPSSLSIAQGAKGTSTITETPSGGFTGSVTLSASGLPSGVTAAFGTNPTTGTSVLTLTASSTATAGTSTVTITGVSGSITKTTTIALTVTTSGGGGGGTGGVTVTPSVSTNSPWFDEEDITLANTAPITALTVTVNVATTQGVTYSSQYNSAGTTVTMTHASGTTITYTFTLASGQTLGTGTGWKFACQMNGNGTTHVVTGDTYTVNYTTGGTAFKQTGTL